MESIIDNASYVFLGLLVGFLLTIRIRYIQAKHRKRFDDTNIEWYGPEICLKDKDYEQRNNTSNNRTNKIDANGFNNNYSEDENSGT